jgi:hypothetical protein
MNAFLIGTIILAIQGPDAIYVGIDSKVLAIGERIENAAPMPKIHQLDDVIFAHAGLFKDSLGKLDVEATANASIAEGGNLRQIVDRFALAIQPQLAAPLSDMRQQNPVYFRDNLKRPLEVLFVSSRGGEPRMKMVLFEVADPSTRDIAFRVTRLDCPGDCPEKPNTALALGVHRAADQFLETHRELLKAMGPADTIEEVIEKQALATPEIVGLPTTIVSVDKLGVHYLKGG